MLAVMQHGVGRPALAAAAATSFAISAVASAGTTEVILQIGTGSPGATDVVENIAPPVINNRGDVAFDGVLSDPSVWSPYPQRGLYYIGAGTSTLQELTRTYEPVPPPGGGFFLNFRDVQISDEGSILFASEANPFGNSMYRVRPWEQEILPILQADAPTVTSSDGESYRLYYPQAGIMNRHGQVLLRAIGDAALPWAGPDGLFVSNTSGAVNKVFSERDETLKGDGVIGTFTRIVQHDSVGPQSPYAINSSGQTSFAVGLGLRDNATSYMAVFRGTAVDAEHTLIALSGKAVGESTSLFTDFLSVGIGSSGDSAFIGHFEDPTTSEVGKGLFVGDGSEIREVFRTDQIAPDGDGKIVGFSVYDPLGAKTIRVTRDGEVFFTSVIRETADGEDDGAIFTTVSESLKTIVRTGDTAPDGIATFSRVGHFASNEVGQLAFAASLETQSGDSEELTALFYWSEEDGLQEILREGDPIDGGVVANFGTTFGTWPRADSGGLNELGQVVFSYELADDAGAGVAVWTPDIERIPGDASLDGVVNLADFGILRANFGSDVGTVLIGDFNADRLVNLADFGILRANFGATASADLAVLDAWVATVPEPTAVTTLLAGAGLGACRRRR
jgi:hypothetical protein